VLIINTLGLPKIDAFSTFEGAVLYG